MESANTPATDKLVRVYLKIKAAKEELVRQEKELEKKMELIKRELLQSLDDQNATGLTTNDGHRFHKTVTTRYGTNDWERFGQFVVEHQLPDLYEKRLHQGNIKQFLEDNPDEVLPGLVTDSKYSITITAGKKK